MRRLYGVIFPLKNNNSQNKNDTILKNDMFYIHGKFRARRRKAKEATPPLAIFEYFLLFEKQVLSDSYLLIFSLYWMGKLVIAQLKD
jgi:hypothetical protein